MLNVIENSRAAVRYIIRHLKKGNHKLPNTTIIFNAGPAKICPSFLKGLCQVLRRYCYAHRAELRFPATILYRMRQYRITLTYCAETFAAAVLLHASRCKRVLDLFRINESGDFMDQSQVDWFARVTAILAAASIPIRSYCYTCRTDLNLNVLADTCRINLSTDKVFEYNYIADPRFNRYKVIERSEYNNIVESDTVKKCAGDCKICTYCSDCSGVTIYAPYRK